MSDSLNATFSEREQQLLDCLAHLYDFIFLQDHPLVEALVPDVKGPHRVQQFREIIIDCIEQMRPDSSFETQPKVSRLYNILRLRYIRQQTVQQVLVSLSLSERQFYRDLPKAIQVLGEMLRSGITEETTTSVVVEVEDAPASVQSEVQRARTESSVTRVEIKPLIDGALSVIQSLIDQNQISVTNEVSGDISISDADRTIVRQILILILSSVATAATRIDMLSELTGRYCQVTLKTHLRHDDQPSTSQSIHQLLFGSDVLSVLLNTIDAKFAGQPVDDNEIQLSLSIPLRQTTILVIDDNPNIANLFRRYLTGLPYRIVDTPDSSEAIEFARRIQPQLIILDVMLPGKDGWEILQNLKNHPITLNIPILVCSVLELPTVAMSLGADGYLKKTPGQAEFLKALAQWSDQR